MKYWWVNHNQTVEQEVNGGYLWSPKTEQGGTRSQFYDNMRRARPGDPVLSFAGTHINNVGRVSDFAFSSPKPPEFGTKGSYWDQQGWLLPVVWKKLNHPYKPANDI